MEDHECLEERESGCKGPVTGRPSHAGTGTIIWRCTAHAEKAAQRAQRILEDYPDSPVPPEWFDPTAAGESWDGE